MLSFRTRRLIQNQIREKLPLAIAFLVGILFSRIFSHFQPTQPAVNHLENSPEAVLSDPTLFAQHLRKNFVCNLPSDASCGHETDFFRIFERNGVHVLPVHFYSIVPEVDKLSLSNFQRPKVDSATRSLCEQDPFSSDCPIPRLEGIDFNLKVQLQTIEACQAFESELSSIPSTPELIDGVPEFHSRWACSQHTPAGQACPPYGAIDAQVYHCMIRQKRPRKIIEIGSGHSTYAAIGAIKALASSESIATTLIAIEPYPSPALKRGDFGIPFQLIEKNLQDVDVKVFQELNAGDILFIDSTHIAIPGSDVVHIFTKILPLIAPGVIVHIHDICLPFETAWDWTFKDYRFWNEQYMLHSFLLSNSEWEILYMGALWEHYLTNLLGKFLPLSGSNGSFWMRKKARSG